MFPLLRGDTAKLTRRTTQPNDQGAGNPFRAVSTYRVFAISRRGRGRKGEEWSKKVIRSHAPLFLKKELSSSIPFFSFSCWWRSPHPWPGQWNRRRHWPNCSTLLAGGHSLAAELAVPGDAYPDRQWRWA